MSKQPVSRSWNHPLGAGGDASRRLLLHHVPLGVASAAVLVLLMTLPLFDTSDPNVYSHVDVSTGTFPQQRGEGGPMDHGEGQAEPMDHSRDRAGPMDHGRRQGEPMDHGEDRTGPMDHGRQQGEPTDHGGGQAGPMDSDEMMEMMQSRLFAQRLTVATGYVATALLALTLLIGPANLLLRKRNPVSSYLRRDAGTWTVVFSVVHTIFGLQVHGSGRLSDFLSYFVAPDGSPLLNSFGLGNWTGLAALVIGVGLLALSSDFALRKLKAGTWKNLQRLNYALFALVVAHAFFYGALLRLESPYTLLLALSVIAVFAGQAVGVWLWRRRHVRTAARSA